jgi:hypothetical protein
MVRRLVLAMIVLTGMIGSGVVACSSSASSSSSPSKPPLCSSLDALKASVHKLGEVDVRANGLSELRTNIAQVSADADTVVREAQSHYASEASRLKADVSALKSAASAAQANPSAATLSAVGTAISNTASGVTALADQAASTC